MQEHDIRFLRCSMALRLPDCDLREPAPPGHVRELPAGIALNATGLVEALK
jgi:hypothetical protein